MTTAQETYEDAPAAPAVGIQLHRPVGRPAPERAALMRQMTLAQRAVRSWPAWMTARATMPRWMPEWDDHD